jgi:hypothetical protein
MCGFTDVRKDTEGYYCSRCGQRMREDYEEHMRLTLSHKDFAQLQRQCKETVN